MQTTYEHAASQHLCVASRPRQINRSFTETRQYEVIKHAESQQVVTVAHAPDALGAILEQIEVLKGCEADLRAAFISARVKVAIEGMKYVATVAERERRVLNSARLSANIRDDPAFYSL